MDAARAAVSKITGRKGHTTEVDEFVNPAVTSETVKPHRHEETTEAIDREVHQHHYHTTVQPIAHKETLPEKHVHNIIPQVEREFKHDNEAETHRRVSAELGQFQNTSTTHETRHTTAALPQVVGEHVHHHVHETVQPVIHKETVQPEVVHTTVPIHETHHETAKHHGLSALPMKTLDEFTRAGGVITGNKSHTHEEYEGAPRPYNEKLRTTIENVLPGHHHDHHSSTTGTTGIGGTGSGLTGDHHRGTGTTGGLTGSGLDNRGTTGGLTGSGYDNNRGTSGGLTGAGYDNRGTTGLGNTDVRHGSGLTGHDNRGTTGGLTGSGRDNRGVGSGLTGSGVGGGLTGDRRPDSGYAGDNYGSSRPSAADKMNPRVDADRDGKAGIMD